MGNLMSRPEPPPQAGKEPMVAEPTAAEVWEYSQKNKDDVNRLLSATSLKESSQQLFRYMSGLHSCVRYQEVVQTMLVYLEGGECEGRESLDDRQSIYQFLFDKMGATWFLPQELCERDLVQVDRLQGGEKLFHLYMRPELHGQLQQALLWNYPYILTKQVLKQFVKLVMDNCVYVEHQLFLRELVMNKQTQSRAVERAELKARMLSVLKQEDFFAQIKQLEMLQNNYVEAAYQFLTFDYPHGAALLFRTLIDKGYKLSPTSHRFYLQIRLFQYLLNQLYHFQLSFFDKIHKLPSSVMVELVVESEGGIENLKKLWLIFEEVGYTDDFYEGTRNYGFSVQCTLNQCIDMIQKGYIKGRGTGEKLLEKILSSKFDRYNLSENGEKVENILTELGMEKYLIMEMGKVINVARLMNIFSVNESLNSLWMFMRKGKGYSGVELQEKALYFIKSIICKYFIMDRSKTIKLPILNSMDSSQLVQLSHPEAILTICEYLYDSLFSISLQHTDIQQIIFQHMLYFDKYTDVSQILNSNSLMRKFAIKREMVEMIIIENITKQINSHKISQVIQYINTQIKMLKSQHTQAEVQHCKAIVRLLKYLEENSIDLSSSAKEKIDISVLYHILEEYPERIDSLNFDQIYEEIRYITDEHLDEEYVMTNQLLTFKSVMAGKAYDLNKKKLGNELIEQISRFQPPWLTTKLINIFQTSKTDINEHIYGIALQSCAKGEDLSYLMGVWKEKEKKKTKHMFSQLIQTERKYLILTDFIYDDNQYRNLVAEMKFSDLVLKKQQYSLFFVLLGTDCQRAFYYALKNELLCEKIQLFLREGVKMNIMNGFKAIEQLYRLLYHRVHKKTSESFSSYKKRKFITEQVLQMIPQKHKSSSQLALFFKISRSYLCSLMMTPLFINTYFDSQKADLIYELLFNEQTRQNMLIQMRDQPMGRSDIILLGKVFTYLNLDFLELCLESLVNFSSSITENGENLLHKLVVLATSPQQCVKILSKIIQKVEKVKVLMPILSYLKDRENVNFQSIITQTHLQILSSLAAIQVKNQYYGIIPSSYFHQPIKYNPKWPISKNHQLILEKALKKTNVFVISKCMYFFYGMNPKIEAKILNDFLAAHSDDPELQNLKSIIEKI